MGRSAPLDTGNDNGSTLPDGVRRRVISDESGRRTNSNEIFRSAEQVSTGEVMLTVRDYETIICVSI